MIGKVSIQRLEDAARLRSLAANIEGGARAYKLSVLIVVAIVRTKKYGQMLQLVPLQR